MLYQMIQAMTIFKIFCCVLVFLTVGFSKASPLAEHLLIRYSELDESFRRFHTLSKEYCTKPTKIGFKSIRHALRHAMNAWMQAQHINFGLIAEKKLTWSFQFWPDRKNLVKSQIEGFLVSHEKFTLNDVAISESAVYGLTAVEYLLYEKGVPKISSDPRRCHYLVLVVEHLSVLANSLINFWRLPEHQQALDVNPEKAKLVLSALTSQSELMYRKVSLPLIQVDPSLAESWRSNGSLMNLEQNILGIRDLYHSVVRAWILKTRSDWIKIRASQALDAKIEEKLSECLSLVRKENVPLATLMKDNVAFLLLLKKNFGQLKNILGHELPEFFEIIIERDKKDNDQ